MCERPPFGYLISYEMSRTNRNDVNVIKFLIKWLNGSDFNDFDVIYRGSSDNGMVGFCRSAWEVQSKYGCVSYVPDQSL